MIEFMAGRLYLEGIHKQILPIQCQPHIQGRSDHLNMFCSWLDMKCRLLFLRPETKCQGIWNMHSPPHKPDNRLGHPDRPGLMKQSRKEAVTILRCSTFWMKKLWGYKILLILSIFANPLFNPLKINALLRELEVSMRWEEQKWKP